MDEEKKVTLDDETYNRMLAEAGIGTAPTYDDSLRRQQNEVYGQITGRGPFQYDPSQDPLYSLYRDRYVQNGRMAMKDTMGQAAALTGGYGSSYGQAVGQQQYDAALQGLNDVIPELYGQAYEMYKDEGDRLQQQYAMLGQQADTEYGHYRDELGDWQYERAWQQQQEETEYQRQQDEFNRLYQLISSSGYEPTEEELAAAGMTKEAAEALREEYLRATKQKKKSGSGGGGGTGAASTADPATEAAYNALAASGASQTDLNKFLKEQNHYSKNGKLVKATPKQNPSSYTSPGSARPRVREKK